MTHWLFPANTKFYDVINAFTEVEAYWPMNAKVSKGDVTFFYLATPYQQIAYLCDVVGVDINLDSILDHIRPFFLQQRAPQKPSKAFMKIQISKRLDIQKDSLPAYGYLKENGLNGMLMGPRKLENNPQLLDYITRNM